MPAKTKYPAKELLWRDVESSNVQAISYLPGSGMLVTFKNGGTYIYEGVSRQRAVACSRAESVGKYIAYKIKPNFKCYKLPS